MGIEIPDLIVGGTRISQMQFSTQSHSTLQWLWRHTMLVSAMIATLVGASYAQAAPFPTEFNLSTGWSMQDAHLVRQPGKVVSTERYFPATHWYPAVVPGTVLTTLVADGVYPEPLYGLNSLPSVIPDSLCRTAYWYRTVFTLPISYLHRQVFLTFNGINYQARIWVNGRRAGSVTGAFRRGIFNVAKLVVPGAKNVLAVEILPPFQPGHPAIQTLGKGYGPNGGVIEGNTPTFFDTIGWDWMPGIADRDMGIWQSVTVHATGPVIIEHPYVTSQITFARVNHAVITVQATVRNETGNPQIGQLTGTLAGRTFESSTVSLPGFAARTLTFTASKFPALYLRSPHLWWPNGYGAHTLYHLTLKFAQRHSLSDRRVVPFGIRSISYGLNQGTHTLKIAVNHVPIMIRGGDWGMDEAMKRTSEARLNAQIKLNAEAGFTMIRNWCGQTTQEDFYRLCDKYGILVWNDYWLDDTVHYGIARQRNVFLANAKDMLYHYRNHPCIAVWCEKNEFPVGPPFESGLRLITKSLDPSRLLQACSSSGDGVGDGYYGIEPVSFYFKKRPDVFHTETGAPSIPTLQDIHAMMPKRDWNTFNDDWTEHDMCQYNYQEALASRYGPITGTADFVRKAQLADYETYRAIFEGANARMLNPYTGIMIWMSNPAQPSMVWQIYSYYLEPDSAYFAVKRACEMIHVQMSPTGQVAVINNTARNLHKLDVEAQVYNLNGSLSSTQKDLVSAKALSATYGMQIVWNSDMSPVTFVRLTLRSREGSVISRNFYWHNSTKKSEDYRDLQSMPHTIVSINGISKRVGSSEVIKLSVTNPGGAVALLTHLQVRSSTSGKRILPAYYSTNYFSLVPGERRAVTIRVAKKLLGNALPLIVVDGWNVTCRRNYYPTLWVAPDKSTGFAHTEQIQNIDCGVGWLPGYSADCYFHGGNQEACDETVTTVDTPLAAPAILYRTDRHGPCNYRIPVGTRHTYTILLHFAETYYTAPNERVFNVLINGKTVLRNFDIFKAAGGKNRALVEKFTDVRSENGEVNIRFENGKVDQPTICGIQVIPQPVTPLPKREDLHAHQ